jgi:type VI protein secretion system component VasK
MADNRERALREFRRMIGWIALAGVLMVAGALWYLSLYEPLRLHMVVATVLGVFFSVLLGCGLFAAAFFSDKSGHDRDVTDATRSARGEQDRASPPD